ncbi:DUF3397 domain-containing protein [Fredinandcohnia sp. 179-A 10B2 NHS]|uniref:DUF3397 domain-containing protein n=1 Tax=Fredinandcohnia sp. 179-A 10B2 NHS TaxID=3235176 RepID=UPI0039A11FB7
MVNFFAGIAATIVTIPLLGFVLVYIISRIIVKNNRKSFFLSVDITTAFFIIAVHYLLLVIVGKSMLWLILLILFLSILTIMYLSWRKTHEIHTTKMIKRFWRFTFLIASFTYFILMVIGLFQRIFTNSIH